MSAAIRRFICRMLWRHNATWHDDEELHVLWCHRCNVVERISLDGPDHGAG